jgi:tetratricopeptide (TPR) repeat protein
MQISGVEDEFRVAIQLGLPRFIYIHADAQDREPLLSELLKDLGGVKYYRFGAQDDLFERIREDLGSELARRWLLARTNRATKVQEPAKFLGKTLARVLRASVIEALARTVEEKRVVEVTGPLGSGKSVLLASLAEHHGWPFLLDAESFRDVVNSVIDAMSGSGELDWDLDFEGAVQKVVEWTKASGNAIVLDACRDPALIANVVEEITRRGGKPRIVFSCVRAQSGAFERFDVPRFSRADIAEYIEKRTGQRPRQEEVEAAERRSSGLPLFLRLVAAEGGQDGTLEDLERARFSRLPANARELVSFLAIADGALSLKVAQDLLEVSAFEGFREIVRASEDLVVCDGDMVDLAHAHVRTTLRLMLAPEVIRVRSQARQVAKALFRAGETTAGVLLSLARGISISLDQLRCAANDAAIVSDMASVAKIEVARRQLLGGDEQHLSEFVHSSLSLAQALSETGRDEDAKPIWEEARKLAADAKDEELTNLVEDMRSVRAALTTFSTADVDRVLKRHEDALGSGDKRTAVHLAIELSTLYLRIREFDKAATYARRARDLFKELGECHGERVAMRNLGAALLSVPAREEEGRAMLEQVSRFQMRSRREEAWWLNLRCRILRMDGKDEEAAVVCEQAITIGEELGDHGIVAMNATNRGNVAADLGDVATADYWYSRASAAAKSAGAVTGEAFASLRQAELWTPEFPNKAEIYASHAVALLRETAATEDLARALRARGKAQERLGRVIEAAESFAEALFTGAGSEPMRLRLFGRAFRLLSEAEGTDRAVKRLLRLACGQEADELVQAVNRLAIELTRRLPGPAGAQLAALAFREVVRGMPSVIRRRFFRLSAKALIDHLVTSNDVSPLIGLLRCDFRDALTFEDVRWFGDMLHKEDLGLSFRVYADGAVALCVALPGERVDLWITLDQLDDQIETALVTVLLWLFLRGASTALVESLLVDVELRRAEVNVKVVAFSETKELGLPVKEEDLGLGGAVTRPSVLGAEVPTIVIFRDGVVAEDGVGLPHLFASILTELAIQFSGREMEEGSTAKAVLRVLRPLFTVDTFEV